MRARRLRARGGAVRASVLAASWRARLSPLVAWPRLAPQDEAAFGEGVERAIGQLLPVFGPAFGIFVVLFGAWDAWIDAAHAGVTVKLRAALVLAGALGYVRNRLGWSASNRLAFVYATHVGAMTIAAALLDGGLVLALPGLAAAMFPLALIEPRLRRCLGVMLAPTLLLGALAAWSLPPKIALNSLFLYALSLLLGAAVALTQGRLRRQAFLAEQALVYACRHDSLSGALSRAYLTETAVRDLALARRHGRPLAVAMLDIDHFKAINDRHGHDVGDAAIRALAATCSHALRGSDYLGRVGGEEFVCVMPETEPAEALACAERIRTLVEALRVPADGGPVRFTVSLGVSVLGAGHADWDALLHDADLALYQAKAGGRNRVVLAAQPQSALR